MHARYSRGRIYFRAQCALSRIRHAAVATLHAFSPHDEDERDDRRSAVRLMASRFSVTRRISISRTTFARLSAYSQPSRSRIADFRRYHQTTSPWRYVNYRLISRQAGHANEVELAYASSPLPLLQERSRINVAAYARTLDPSGQLVHFLLIKLAYRPPSSVVSDPRAAFLSREFNDPVLLPPLPLRLHQSTPPIPRSLVSVATVVLIRIKHTSWGG